ncbi:MAG: class I SAM-dependent methyltransferase [Candidatus Jordarchaeales archaeon]|nr:class I SAM-dependent methyltransferase [Candidatus Jordarchaeia archaeon]
MSLEGKIKVSLSILRRLRKLAGISRFTNMHSALVLAIGLEKLGVIDFLEKPRSLDEVAAFIGDVKRLDFLKELMEVLEQEKVLQRVDGHYKVNIEQLEKLKEMRATNPYFKAFEPLASGFERVLYEVMRDVLRGAEFDFVSPEVATIFYFQNASPLYSFGREMLLELGGGKRLKGKKILDLGCGFGNEPITLLKYLDFDCHLICADFFPNVVDECMHTTIEINGQSKSLRELENVEFVVLDPSMRKPFPIADEYVDAVFSFALLHWSKHPDKIISECARVLKKNGKLMMVTPLKKEGSRITTADVLLKLEGGNKIYTRKEVEKFLVDAKLTDYTIFISHMIVAKKS